METFIFQNCSPEERKQMLEQRANGREKLTYMRTLTEAEIESESRKLAKLCTERNDLEQEKADVAKEYSDKIREVKTKIDGHAKMLNDGHKEECGICYKFVNIDTREVGFYNANGELVRCRELMDQDLQMDMFGGSGNMQPAGELPAPGFQHAIDAKNGEYEEAVVVTEEDTEDEDAAPWDEDD